MPLGPLITPLPSHNSLNNYLMSSGRGGELRAGCQGQGCAVHLQEPSEQLMVLLLLLTREVPSAHSLPRLSYTRLIPIQVL